ncbi:hypothetical protein Salmuc_01009 [Salipiger mucosus DSM 16094]|uniref:Uncharacterized protein n=1 Tax=Salipiger mucosus DSM 16094 TaxID=1123237 RepID=S9Q3J4_9RHOB|nr:hypothetical protein Salmuc_01009 [Salipiger mucosus DSM 16094]
MAQVRVHAEALAGTQITEMAEADRTALSILNEARPLDVRLLDSDGAPHLYIESRREGHALTMEVQNVSTWPMRLRRDHPRDDAGQPLLDSAQHPVTESALILELTAQVQVARPGDPLPEQQLLKTGAAASALVTPPAGWPGGSTAVTGRCRAG